MKVNASALLEEGRGGGEGGGLVGSRTLEQLAIGAKCSEVFSVQFNSVILCTQWPQDSRYVTG